MGFGAGFGEAFSKSYNDQRQRSHERQTDEFRYRMETLIKKKDKYDSDKKADEAAVNRAKEYIQMTGQDPAVIGEVYKMIRDGMSEDYIIKKLNGGKFKITKGDEPAKPEDQQMTDAGLTNPTATTKVAPATPAAGMDGGGLLSQIFPGIKAFKSGSSGVDARVAQTSGMSAEEQAQVNAGYTPPPMDTGTTFSYTPNAGGDLPKDAEEAAMVASDADAALKANPEDPTLKSGAEIANRRLQAIRSQDAIKANQDAVANGFMTPGQETLIKVHDGAEYKYVPGTFDSQTNTYLDMDGNPIKGGIGMSPKESEDLAKLSEKLGPEAQKTSKHAIGWAGMARAGAAMRGTVEQSKGKVLQDWVTWAAQFGQGITGELAAAADVLQKSEGTAVGEMDPKSLEDDVKKIKSIKDDYSRSEAGQLAKQKLLFDAQNRLMAYYYGQAFDQDGKALSQIEAEMFAKMTSGGNDPGQFYENMAGNLLPLEKQIKSESIALSSRPEVQAYKIHWRGLPDILTPVDPRMLLKGDSGAEDLLHAIEPYANSASGANATETTEPPADTKAPPANRGQFASPAEVDAAVAAGTLKSGDTFTDANGKTRTVP